MNTVRILGGGPKIKDFRQWRKTGNIAGVGDTFVGRGGGDWVPSGVRGGELRQFGG